MKPTYLIPLSVLLLALTACSEKKSEPAPEAPATQPAAQKAPPAKAPEKKPEVATGVNFVNLKDGAQVGTELKLSFAVNGKTIRPAGEDAEDKSSGHHHVIIDGAAMAAGTVIPMNETHKHYGKGQTEAVIKLAPGPHTLTLQFADGAHRSYGPEWSQTVKVVAVAAAAADAPQADAPKADAPKADAPKADAPAEKK